MRPFSSVMPGWGGRMKKVTTMPDKNSRMYTQMIPREPIRGSRAVAIAGPRKVVRPEARLCAEIAAPRCYGANAGKIAPIGTNAVTEQAKMMAAMSIIA